MTQDLDTLRFQVTYAGQVQELTFDRRIATVAHLQTALERAYRVPARSQKLLLPKGKKLDTTRDESLLVDQLQTGDLTSSAKMTKLLLIGQTKDTLCVLEHEQSQRQAKHSAYQHYERHKPQPVRNTTSSAELLEKEQYRFQVIRPFERDVPQWDKRNAMLERLANDEAVRAIMVKHR